jgi:hypothetical protein
MNCSNCGTQACKFYISETSGSTYYLCRGCGRVWPAKGSTVICKEILNDEVEMLDKLSLDSFEAYTEAAVKQKMFDCFYNCPVCTAKAFEVSLGYYKCSNIKCKYECEL